jgi:hypothetical protein
MIRAECVLFACAPLQYCARSNPNSADLNRANCVFSSLKVLPGVELAAINLTAPLAKRRKTRDRKDLIISVDLKEEQRKQP